MSSSPVVLGEKNQTKVLFRRPFSESYTDRKYKLDSGNVGVYEPVNIENAVRKSPPPPDPSRGTWINESNAQEKEHVK